MILKVLFCSSFCKGMVKGLSTGDGLLASESWGNKGHPHGRRQDECKAIRKLVGLYPCDPIIRLA